MKWIWWKQSISQYYVDSSHQISCYELLVWKMKWIWWKQVFRNVTLIVHIKYPLGTSCMKNEINLMKTSILQCYVDSSHQISCKNFLYKKWNKFNGNKYFAMLRW